MTAAALLLGHQRVRPYAPLTSARNLRHGTFTRFGSILFNAANLAAL
jgi:hypothetical protein